MPGATHGGETLAAWKPVPFGTWLKRTRESRGWEVKEFSRRTGIGMTTITDYEHAHIPAGSKPRVEAFARFAHHDGAEDQVVFAGAEVLHRDLDHARGRDVRGSRRRSGNMVRHQATRPERRRCGRLLGRPRPGMRNQQRRHNNLSH